MPEVFLNLVSLVSLRLRDNILSTLPFDLFSPLARLSVLDLSHNYIESIHTTVLRQLETRISTLRLQGTTIRILNTLVSYISLCTRHRLHFQKRLHRLDPALVTITALELF